MLDVLFVLAATESAAEPSRDALYAAISAVVVSLVAGTVAIITSRNSQRNAPVPDVSPKMSDLYEDALDRIIQATRDAEMWEQRALDAGWKP